LISYEGLKFKKIRKRIRLKQRHEKMYVKGAVNEQWLLIELSTDLESGPGRIIQRNSNGGRDFALQTLFEFRRLRDNQDPYSMQPLEISNFFRLFSFRSLPFHVSALSLFFKQSRILKIVPKDKMNLGSALTAGRSKKFSEYRI